jgi:hypothetical protein
MFLLSVLVVKPVLYQTGTIFLLHFPLMLSFMPPGFNLSGLYSPKLASFLELLPTLRYPAACCGEVHYIRFSLKGYYNYPLTKAKSIPCG